MSESTTFEAWQEREYESSAESRQRYWGTSTYELMRSAWQASRAAALEEAAQACEATYVDQRGPLRVKRPIHETAHDCASAIRSLSSQAGKEKGDK